MPKTGDAPRKPRASRTDAVLHRIAEAQEATQRELHDLIVQVRHLTTAQRRTEEHVAIMASRMNRIDGQLGNVAGWALEQQYRDRASGYFADLLSGIRVLSHDEVGRLLDPAVAAGTITQVERRDAIGADIVLRGQRIGDNAEAYLVAEVSASISTVDTERAVRRSRVIARATGRPVLAVVAGGQIHPDADAAARAAGAWRVLDGTTLAPTDATAPDRSTLDG